MSTETKKPNPIVAFFSDLFGKTPEEVEEKMKSSGADFSGKETIIKTDEALNARIAEFEAKQVNSDAEKAVAKLLADGKMFPAEQARATAAFAQAMRDDKANPGTVCFSEGDVNESRTENLTALFSARNPHGMFGEAMLDPERQVVLANFMATTKRGAETKVDEAEVDRLLSMTDAGRAAIAARKK